VSTRVYIGTALPNPENADYVIATVVDAHVLALEVYDQRPLKVFASSPTDERLLALCAQWLEYAWDTLPARVIVFDQETWRELDEAWLIAQAGRYGEGMPVDEAAEYVE
jgi:hypothetical protein